MAEIPTAQRLLWKSFRVMASNKLDDRKRSRKLRKIRRIVDGFQPTVISTAAKRELRDRQNSSFVYKLFLQNILLAGKL